MTLIINSDGNRSLLADSLLEVLATGQTDGLPSKVMVEVRCSNPSQQISEIGSGLGKFNLEGSSSFEYDTDSTYRYDYKIIDDSVLVISSSVNQSTVELQESGKLTMTYGVNIGGGITMQDWWKTQCVLVNIVRIDLLTNDNVTLARQQPNRTFAYTSGLHFDFIIEIDPSEITESTTIDDEWLIELADVMDGSGSPSTLKVDYVEIYDEDDTLLEDRNENRTKTDLSMIPYNHEIYNYRAASESIRPDGIPKYFKIKTDQGKVIYQDEFNWSPDWLAGDTLVFTYSV